MTYLILQGPKLRDIFGYSAFIITKKEKRNREIDLDFLREKENPGMH